MTRVVDCYVLAKGGGYILSVYLYYISGSLEHDNHDTVLLAFSQDSSWFTCKRL